MQQVESKRMSEMRNVNLLGANFELCGVCAVSDQPTDMPSPMCVTVYDWM